jgi:sugar/nucleoside kinase (ribokinase family)
MHSIAVAGHICLDIAPLLSDQARIDPGSLVEVGPLTVTLGGSVANTGGALTSLGMNVFPYATIGDDELGRLLTEKLTEEGFSAPQLSVSPRLATSYSLVIEKEGVDRTFWHHTGANAEFTGAAVDSAQHPLLHIGYPPLLPGLLENNGDTLRHLFAQARAAGVTTSLDLAVVDPDSPVGSLDWEAILRSIFGQTDIATPSLDDLTSALDVDQEYSPEGVEALAEQLITQGVAIVAISAGQHGLHLRTASEKRLREGGAVLAALPDSWADRSITVAPLPVDHPVTTNGAGDASTAGLLFGLSRGATPEQAAELAVTCSAVAMNAARPTPQAVSQLNPALASVFYDQGRKERQ